MTCFIYLCHVLYIYAMYYIFMPCFIYLCQFQYMLHHYLFMLHQYFYFCCIVFSHLCSLSHRPTLITKSIVFWKIGNLLHEKCSSSSGTRAHDFCSYVFCLPRYPLAPLWSEDLTKIH